MKFLLLYISAIILMLVTPSVFANEYKGYDAQFCQETAYRKAGEVQNVQCTQWVFGPTKRQSRAFNFRRR